jgi:hypothetical protein
MYGLHRPTSRSYVKLCKGYVGYIGLGKRYVWVTYAYLRAM